MAKVSSEFKEEKFCKTEEQIEEENVNEDMKPKQQQDSSMHTTTTTAQDNRDYDNNNNNNNNNNNSSNVNKSVYLINNKGQEENKPKNKKTRTIIACRQKSLNMNQQIRTNEKFGQKLSLLLLTNQNSVARIENSLSSLTMNSHEYNKHQSPLPLPPSPPPPPAVPVSIDTTFAIIHQSTSTRLYDKNDDYDMRKQMKHTNSGSNRSGKLTTTTTTLSSEHEGKQRSYGLQLIQRIHPTTVSSVSPSTTVTKTTTTMGTSLPTSSEIPESKYLNQSENTEIG
uniref:Uncharacterized protein n=1 Tax=Trichobilharzia regenti TaxID=157069 RepID=A0AA85J7U4_TRIRE|nr:unnamed protein product [Trichobilharzia regenti]